MAEEIGKKVYASQTDELMAEFEKEWGKVPGGFLCNRRRQCRAVWRRVYGAVKERV